MNGEDIQDAKKPLPDCVNCANPECTGECSGGGCSGGCASGCSGGESGTGCSGGGCASGCSAVNRSVPAPEDDDLRPGAEKGNSSLTPSDFKFNEDREPRGKIFATDWLSDISTSADFPIVQVQFKNTRNAFYANPQKINLNIGDLVAVEASPGHDIGRVAMVGPLVGMQMKKYRLDPETAELKKIFRIATPQDLERFEAARKREHDTMIRSRVIAEELGLDMKIGDVEYQGDGSKAIFYYIADERVDFRKLIRLLADAFHVRIEMKQIGARQEAGRIGGIGPCGRPLCCSSWMTHFVSVGTGAARMQDLSMNPQKLAGQCAKLKCCLNFEIDTYAESSKNLPGRDVVLETKDGEFYYFKADILQRMVTYSSDRKIPANLVTIPASRAFEIIALNKQGIKVDRLLEAELHEEPNKEYIDLTDQDSLTRFDRTRPRKQKKERKQGKQEIQAKQTLTPKPENTNRQDNKSPNGQQKPKGENPKGKKPVQHKPKDNQQSQQKDNQQVSQKPKDNQQSRNKQKGRNQGPRGPKSAEQDK